ncbi:MAG: hypothetical protein ACYS5F_13525 [Planctomycetota bacterium]|jgi:hypothetical protein
MNKVNQKNGNLPSSINKQISDRLKVHQMLVSGEINNVFRQTQKDFNPDENSHIYYLVTQKGVSLEKAIESHAKMVRIYNKENGINDIDTDDALTKLKALQNKYKQ